LQRRRRRIMVKFVIRNDEMELVKFAMRNVDELQVWSDWHMMMNLKVKVKFDE
jgi:hypothetical protein